jgi:molybdate transport system permease protein
MLTASAWTPLWLTLKVASLATLLAFASGVAIAYFVARRNIWGKEVIDAILTLPMVLPPTVLGYYLILLVGRRGVVGQWLDAHFDFSLMFTWQGAVIAAAVVSFPLVFKSARAAYEGVEPNLENAGRTLGLSEFAVFVRITFPLARRGILAGTLLGFARAMGEFGATLMVAGNLPGRTQTLSLAIYDAVQSGNDDLANLYVFITSAVCIVILVASSHMLRVRYV